MRTRWAVATVLLLALAGCGVPALPDLDDLALPGGVEQVPAPPDLPDAATSARHLDGLDVADRRDPSVPAYARSEFGTAWADTDGNGCNQRDDVLLRDAVPGSTTTARQGRCDHDVLAGTWVDPYTGATLVLDDLKDLRQAQAVQIDHVVPLAEAWASGAYAWSDERRRRYANDLGVLLAVDGPTNASKGSGDPAAWRPRKAYQCAYALRWVEVKRRWRLTVDAPEVRALHEMLAYCPRTGTFEA